MDLNLCRENITVNETVFNGMLEHSVELDYMLPDYCPNIFQVLKSSMSTAILSKHLSGNKLILDGIAFIKIIYIGEENGRFHQLEQKQVFSKTLELKEDCSHGQVNVTADCGFLNCRAVNQRRLDIRGSINMKVAVLKPKQIPVITDCDSLQLHRKRIEIVSQNQQVTKEFTVKETLELGHNNPPIQDIIHYTASAVSKDYKILANKIICKGDISLHALYTCKERPEQPETIEHSIPISQIVDFDGIDEGCQSVNFFEVLEYDIDLQVDDDGECRSFMAILKMKVTCEVSRTASIEPVDDCYSTRFETALNSQTVTVEQLKKPVFEHCMFKNNVSVNQNEISYLYDILYSLANVTYKSLGKSLEISADLKLSILASNSENIPVCLEESVLCKVVIDTGELSESISFHPTIQITTLSYAITSFAELEIRGEIEVCGILYESIPLQVLSEISLSEDQPKEKDPACALRIYFAECGENVWDIAKRYNTSLEEILKQNALEEEIIKENGMIFIPMMD